ncbi:MAG: hypothetical protein NW224_23210 [Leptolyngbyaceae cyanobacterium bins.302]|nr:hypothetical protein [Leptolyngbyaceae cyanobacterium bins.302]
MTIAPQPNQTNLYEADYLQWIEQTISQLKSRKMTLPVSNHFWKQL